MAEHERINTDVANTDVAPDTDPIPVQTAPQVDQGVIRSADQPPVQQAYHKARRTSGLWVRMTIAAVVLVVLLVFIIENLQSVDIGFFGAHLHLPLGVALLLAAVCGVLLVSVLSAGRILQLRRTLRKAVKS